MQEESNLEIAYTADHPDLVPTISNWIVAEWQVYDPTLTLERSIRGLKEKLNRDKVPLSLVVFLDGEPVGQVALKKGIVVPGYDKFGPWIGSLYVKPEHRGRNIAKALLAKVTHKAQSLGYEKIYLFTSIATLPAWYASLGWKTMAKDQLHGNPVTLMEFTI